MGAPLQWVRQIDLPFMPSDLRRLSFQLCFSINTLHLQNSILRLAIKTMTYKTHFCALLLNQLVKGVVIFTMPCALACPLVQFALMVSSGHFDHN